MKQQLVYDLPTRLFHWLFAGLFLTSFIIAKTIDDDSFWFNYHSIAGLTLGFLVFLRLIWGVFGTQHARFSGFVLSPHSLIGYFKGILSGAKDRWAGHNPASSWAAISMMFFALGLVTTGLFMTASPYREAFEDIHEILATGFILVVGLHVAGIVLHTIRFQEMIGLSMINGKKANIPDNQKIKSSKVAFGILLIVLVLGFGLHLLQNYNKNDQSLYLFGTALQLGENDEAENEWKNEYLEDEYDEDDE